MSGPARRWVVPEVVQTSAMDCGPACLKAVLEGFGIRASYGRLREACQTGLDGTSISALAETLQQVGLCAEEVMVPTDHLLLPEVGVLPAIVVVTRPDGLTHFAVAWRRHGPLLQVMDPAVGRRWVSCARFLEEVYVHAQEVPASAWRAFQASEETLRVLRRRLRRLGAPADGEVEAAIADPGWRPIATLDAVARMVEHLGGAGAVGPEFVRAVLASTRSRDEAVPDGFWQVRQAAEGQVRFRGAVLVRIAGRAPRGAGAAVPPEVQAALEEKPERPGVALLRLLRADGLLQPSALLAALLFSACGAAVEALLFRGLLQVGHDLALARQRAVAIGALLLFLSALLALELPSLATSLRIGRHLEARLRAAWLAKIPRLGDPYFRSRPVSDMAERSHNAHQLRQVPELARDFVRCTMELLVTAAAIGWLDPPSAPLAALAAGVALAVPLALQHPFLERDLRARVHVGALGLFNLDALLGLVPIRAHRAERCVRREHEGLLTDWARARRATLRVAVWTETLQLVSGLALAGLLLQGSFSRGGDTGRVLLLTYWALLMPLLGSELAGVVRRWPHHRSLMLRLLEPLTPAEGGPAEAGSPRAPARSAGAMEVRFEGVSIRATGHTLLESLELTIAPGAHVAVVGPSGAGKSTLLGALLGWHAPAQGRIAIDDTPLDALELEAVRRETAWIDPGVQVWNRSLLENLRFGASDDGSVGRVLGEADLLAVLEGLPDGLQTALGEAGGLLSGGEGQRVRLGRGMMRPGARLVLLDEPFRGLDRDQRSELLARARALWKEATLLCVLHDVRDALAFERVLVLEQGRIVEDGAPADIAGRPGSRLGALLAAEEALEGAFQGWRRVRLADGRLREEARA
jgi:ATP-binding cassette subfamily B protein